MHNQQTIEDAMNALMFLDVAGYDSDDDITGNEWVAMHEAARAYCKTNNLKINELIPDCTICTPTLWKDYYCCGEWDIIHDGGHHHPYLIRSI